MKTIRIMSWFVLGCVAIMAAGYALSAPPAKGGQQKPKKETKKMGQLPTTPVTAPQGKEIATLGGGCFWCTEAIFLELKGVEKVVSGYSGGHKANPSYEEVCNGATGHAEAIQITFNPKAIAYKDLLRVFLTTHDPTTLNRQGADVGTQYRSAIFTHGDAQKKAAKEVIEEITKAKVWKDPIVTEVTPFANFYGAETYHQDYYSRNMNKPYCQIVIAPKVAKFRQMYREKLKK